MIWNRFRFGSWRVPGMMFAVAMLFAIAGEHPLPALADAGVTPQHCEKLKMGDNDLFEGLSPQRLGFPSQAEAQQVEAWLRASGLNRYGDPGDEGRVYAGGTPLFDEARGEYITVYELLVQKYPHKPWLKDTPQ